LAYLSLFVTALIAATLLPLSSEALLAALLSQGKAPVLLWLAASLGNVLGSCINWVLGRWCLHWQDRRWFPIGARQLQRAQTHFQRYGSWSLLFAWLPLVGDPLTLVAGVMKIPFSRFVLLVAIGKMLRYALVIWAAQAAL